MCVEVNDPQLFLTHKQPHFENYIYLYIDKYIFSIYLSISIDIYIYACKIYRSIDLFYILNMD